MSEDIAPRYRVRLFLSADLSGSTDFKNKQKNPMDWVPKFKDFYSTFLTSFASQYDAYCQDHSDMCEEFREEIPKLWKTVGDEVIFVNRVQSCAQVIAYVHSFKSAMDAYSKKLKDDKATKALDVKGNGWLASFPYPNQTIDIRNQDNDLLTEELEKQADEKPHEFEFLGSGIDSGFRISKNSTPSFFTVSPSLASILCMTHNNEDTVGKLGQFEMEFRGVNQLKGVIDGQDFPVIGINTERNEDRKNLVKSVSELDGNLLVDQTKLKTYLKKFEAFHQVSTPALKLEGANGDVAEPDFYSRTFLPTWKAEFEKNNASNDGIDASAKEAEGNQATKQELEELEKSFPKDKG